MAVAAALALPLGAAQAGDLAGRVTDGNTGRPLPNAIVKVIELGRSATTDRNGEYRLPQLPAGSYKVEVDYVGFATSSSQVAVPDTGEVEQSFALGAGLIAQGVEEITVTGYRLAQATALQDKKSSNIIKDSVTADDAGKLPDQNAAEALRRVTGVSVTVDQGEGRYVTVRGIDPSFTSITLDSQVIGTPEGSTRRVALDTIPSELLAKLEVVKAVTPDMDGNSVGGSVNIVTPSAFDDPDGRFLSATIDAGYYELNGKHPYSGALGWGRTFGANDQFGVVLSGSYSYRKYDSENLQGGDPWVEEGDHFVPDEVNLRDYTIERERKGFVANFEWQASDEVKLYFRNLYNRFEDVELQSEVIWDYRNGDLLDQTPTSGLFTEGEGERLISERLEIQSIQTSSLGGEFVLGNWKLGASLTYGEADQDTPYDREWSFELADEMPMTYDTGRRFFSVDAGPGFHDPSAYEFNQYSRGGQLVEEEVKVGQLDLERFFRGGSVEGSIKFGGKLVNRDKRSNQDMVVYDGFDGDLLMTPFIEPGKTDFYSSEQRYEYGPRINYHAVESFYSANAAAFEANAADTASESYGVDYTITEDVTAGYVMGTLNLGRTVLTGGVRVERTESEYTGFDVVLTGDDAAVPNQLRGEKNYTNWLPGLQARFNVSDDLILRAAWTNTIGRPSYETTVPYRLFEIDDTEGEIEMGNPGLDPLESMNFDASFEWYLEAGIVSAGFFYKDIDNPIFQRFIHTESDEPFLFEGREFNELTISRPENAESGKIMGLELNYQQQLRMLPYPFDGLGVAINYTYSDSESKVFDRPDELPFFLQSEHVGNLALFYEKRGLELRLAYTYRSEYLDELGDSPATDLWIDAHGQLDFKSSYEFTPHFTAFLQLQNITDEPLRLLSGNRRRLAENEIYSWNATMGVQLKF